jgi:cytoskeletal protein CcmA (bactofilin family)
MMRVSARAMSVFCPHCQKRATLEDLRVAGTHPGKFLATCGDILVEHTSILNLEIVAKNVVIQGRVCGAVTAQESVVVGPTARVIGDVRAPKIVVQDGGVIQGQCEVLSRNTETSSPPAASAAAETSPQVISPTRAPAPASPGTGRSPVTPGKPPAQIRPIQWE